MTKQINNLSKSLEDIIKEMIPENPSFTDAEGNKYELQLDENLNIILVKI